MYVTMMQGFLALFILVYTERERERERDGKREGERDCTEFIFKLTGDKFILMVDAII